MQKSFPIYYETLGNPKNPAIILIAGLGAQLINWSPLLTQGLADKGFYVVLFDNRDAGLSRYYNEFKTPNLKEALAAKQAGKLIQAPYMLENMASDVILLLNKLDIDKAHILGMSMGGMIAQLLALNYPKRVSSLTCIATTTGDSELPQPNPDILNFFFSAQRQEENFDAYLNSRIALHKIYTHPKYYDEEKIGVMVEKSYHRAYNPSGFTRQMLAILCAEPRTEKLKALQTPTLVIHGDYDPIFSIAHGQHLAAILPNSRLAILENMGHGLPDSLNTQILDLFHTFYRDLHVDACFNSLQT
jgi:pimeloyl-ACP methyl ester carboxylesterase